VELDGLDHVALTVSDVASAVAWYADVLGLRRVYAAEWGDYPAMLVSGGTGVALFPVSAGHAAGDASAADGNRHLAFRASRAGYAGAKAELTGRGIAFDEQDHQVSWSIYFADPDGHLLEITTYERSGS
jgi:catechol 2,3-dioxygenase-like lactoylglutathione lyase family enzyme